MILAPIVERLAVEPSLPIFFSLFEVFRPTREFFTHLETSPLLVQGCNFDICSALMAIEQ